MKLAEKAGMRPADFDMVFSGDLLNQCIGSSFTLRNMGIPHLGLYGACSTMAESLLMASMTVGGGFADKVVAMTSSHFASSERQYRFPLGYGGQRTPTSQWTVTGSGAALVCSTGKGPKITGCTIEGPISYDIAFSKEIADFKKFESPVAGEVDAMIMPSMATGNMVGKSWTVSGDGMMAGIIVGAKAPVVLTSRGSTAEEKFYSIALAAAASN